MACMEMHKSFDHLRGRLYKMHDPVLKTRIKCIIILKLIFIKYYFIEEFIFALSFALYTVTRR